MVPEGWSYKRLGELGTEKYPAVKAGPFGSSLKKEFYTRDGFKIYGQEQVISGDPHFGNYFINKEKFEELKSCSVKPGDILISLVGTIGRVLIIPKNARPGIINPRLLRISVAKDKVYELFLKYYLEDNSTKHKLLSWAQGGTMGVLNAEMLKNLSVPIPPLLEQKKIARILSTWDKAIETVENLIENSKAQKKALMQQLLTGKRRLPGFDGEWKTNRLKDLAEINSGGTPKSSVTEYYNGDIPWVSIADMTKQGKYISATEKNITALGLDNSSARLYPKHTVLYAMYASIGECSISTVELCSSQAILGIRPNAKLNAQFLYYYLSSLKEKIKLQGQQGTQSNLNAGMVKGFKLNLPSIEEQQKIATVLTTADKEIETLQQKLDCLKQEKKALMQQLLTGKRRVKLEAAPFSHSPSFPRKRESRRRPDNE